MSVARLPALAVVLSLLTLPLAAADEPRREDAPRPGHAAGVAPAAGPRVIGRSVEGRRVLAYRVGSPQARRTAVVMSTMHGDERDTVDVVTALRDARVRGVNLWLVPVHNRDGYAAGTRHNARDVDLNRNFPVRWASLPGGVAGPGPASEPETRSLMRFLRRVDPDLLVSLHQPLHGVDTSHRKQPRFLRRLAAELRLPLERMDCSGGCHGTMTQWFNRRHDGFAVTVELPADPSRRYLARRAPRGLLRALGARRRVPVSGPGTGAPACRGTPGPPRRGRAWLR